MAVVLGEEVGYAIRFDVNSSAKTVIKFTTDGWLLRETMNDPLFSKYSVIMVDEAHERSLNSDILMGLLKKVKRKRKDLRIIVTSATMNAKKLMDFFETNKNPIEDPSKNTAVIMSVEGRLYPVDILYLTQPCNNYIRCCVDTIINIHKLEPSGDILAFLPGAEDIDMVIFIYL